MYGSWNNVAPRLETSQTMDVAQRLAEAIGDNGPSPLPTQPQVTMATRSGRTKTGFQTASDQ